MDAEDEFAFHLRAHEVEYKREYRFHVERRWRADFFIEPDLLIEIDGGIWRKGGGAHSRPTNIIRDIEKHNAAVLSGFRVLRFTPEMVRNGLAIEAVQRALAVPA